MGFVNNIRNTQVLIAGTEGKTFSGLTRVNPFGTVIPGPSPNETLSDPGNAVGGNFFTGVSGNFTYASSYSNKTQSSLANRHLQADNLKNNGQGALIPGGFSLTTQLVDSGNGIRNTLDDCRLSVFASVIRANLIIISIGSFPNYAYTQGMDVLAGGHSSTFGGTTSMGDSIFFLNAQGN